jgi:hypothetical protein
MSRYAEDIRKIAKQGSIKGALSPKQDREPILGGTTDFITGVFSQGSTGGDSGTGSGTTDNPNGSTKQEDIKPKNPANPQTFYRGGGGTSSTTETVPTTGIQDVESVIDGEAGPQSSYDYNSSIAGSGGSLDGITGLTDCSTGQGINIRYDGNFPPPDGWDDADTPPSGDDGTWVANTYLVTSALFIGVATIVAATVGDSFQQAQAAIIASSATYDYVLYSPVTRVGTNAWTFQWYSSLTAGGTTGVVTTYINRIGCNGEGDPYAACSSSPPLATEWPTDGSYDLSLIEGSFQTNPYDSEAPADAGGSAVNFCFSGGTRQGRLYATAQGGTMLVETSVGAPTGTAKVYGSDGRLQSAGDATNSFMDQYLPK